MNVFRLTILVRTQTKGRSLEEMESVFGSKETAFDAEAVRRKAEEEVLEPEQRSDSLNKTA